MLDGSDAFAKPVDTADWCAVGESPYGGTVYTIYEYRPGAAPACTAPSSSDIRVWLGDGVTWAPVAGPE